MYVILTNYFTLSQMGQVTTYQIRRDVVYVLILRVVNLLSFKEHPLPYSISAKNAFVNFVKVSLSIRNLLMSQSASGAVFFLLTELDDFSLPGWWLGVEPGVTEVSE